MRTLLICHDTEELNRIGLARWLASFSSLAGIVVIDEPGGRMRKRILRETQRIGWLRFLDVLAFRLWYRLFQASHDAAWERDKLAELARTFPEVPGDVPILRVASPNSPETIAFIREANPDIVIARCKTLLIKDVYDIPAHGTFVMHPGICPEYRNAHGCFWALANDDRDKVGMSLLRIDDGIDTGPIYGYYSYDIDEVNESHIVIQLRTVFDNLAKLEMKFKEIVNGTAQTIDTSGRPSGEWGQPWLSAYRRWKRTARSLA